MAQVLFGQHGCSAPPQAAHVPVVPPPAWQTLPGEQVAEPPVPTPLQQGWVASPQATQRAELPAVPALQTVLGAVQRLLQHGASKPPQLPHAPSVQMPVMAVLQA